MRIVLTGGGTAGHLFPLIAVARQIKNLIAQNIWQIPLGEGSGAEFAFIGPATLGEETLASEGIACKRILAGKWRRYGSLENLLDVFKLPIGFCQALWHLFWLMPNVIFSKGGFGSVPVVMAAWIFRIPVLVHESDAIPGLANRLTAKMASRIAVSFSETAKFFPAAKTALTGNPVREEIQNGDPAQTRIIFNLVGAKPLLLFLGGSQGAQALNEVIVNALPRLLARCEIIHQCGANNFEAIKQFFKKQWPAGYFLSPFLDENQLRAAYAAADLIISRAGAGSISEIALLGKPSIIIPLPNSAADHQTKNARDFSQSGAAEILEQINLTPNLLQNEIFSLLDKPDLLKQMGEKAKQFARPQAAKEIAQEILKIAKW
ncbi:MAG: undecaprenyldiphospho-muramoylpentapeptide beta-N-acetylglucosaminyltransferase [Candidatus Portnoybacteria bacterium]|jgi:UDP-N-acetylglucosamine--N-acetylmuramyl-(pentapeptide) pyrophosphoryl-undecaprenol N-acetylglucosamine transferase|nr:undecaprenyldiphospho-muramoylpentapeptide beta-N-acetylglucosaminyltransferase [Candidatus Portnoybacteria bacterium]